MIKVLRGVGKTVYFEKIVTLIIIFYLLFYNKIFFINFVVAGVLN